MHAPSYKPVVKRAKKGFRGYPVGTIAFYGPDNRRASKVVVAIIPEEGADPSEMKKWFSESGDVRRDEAIGNEIVDFVKAHGVRSTAMTDRIIGCPHEEGIDYPDGQSCPSCPFWAGKNRWTGEVEH
jgi:hypothetical protein